MLLPTPAAYFVAPNDIYASCEVMQHDLYTRPSLSASPDNKRARRAIESPAGTHRTQVRKKIPTVRMNPKGVGTSLDCCPERN